MISFQPITPGAREVITRYIWTGDYRNCDFAFANMCAWQFLYHTEYAEWHNTLFIRFSFPDGSPAYMMPIGRMSWIDKLRVIVDDIAQAGGDTCMIPGIVPEMMRTITDEYSPENFSFADYMTTNEDYSDYIYLRSDLATLSGKRLQPKRNHINRFEKTYPDHCYNPLTPDMVASCMALEDDWLARNKNTDNAQAVENEHRAIAYSLSHFEELALMGGTLWVGDRLVAFTYGSPINYDTFGVHVEKADEAYIGAYPMINREFARNIPEAYIYINREEDLGISGLRQAKRSYNPYRLLSKSELSLPIERARYIIAELDSDACYEEDFSFHSLYTLEPFCEKMTLDSDYRSRLQRIWQDIFGDSTEFISMYFDRKIAGADIYVMRERGALSAVLYNLPYTLRCWGSEIPIGYWSGLATLPQYRGKGLMTDLMYSAMNSLLRENVPFVALIPGDQSLVRFYADRGFVPFFYRQEHRYEVFDAAQLEMVYSYSVPLEMATLCDEWQRLTIGRSCVVQHTADDMEAVVADLQLGQGDIVYVTDSDSRVVAMAFASPRIDELFLHDVAAVDAVSFCALLSRLYKKFNFRRLRMFTPEGENAYRIIPGVRYCEELSMRAVTGMVRILNPEPLLECYAKAHPKAAFILQFDFPELSPDLQKHLYSQYRYKIAEGRVTAIHEECAIDYDFCHDDFVRWLFEKQEGAYPFMSLMMSDDLPAQ